MRKQCIIVGNADLEQNLSQTIDSADYVVRFNRCRTFNMTSGTKTDTLVLVNTDAGYFKLKNRQWKIYNRFDFDKNAAVLSANKIVLPVHPLIIKEYYKKPFQGPSLFSKIFKGKKLDWTCRFINLFGRNKKIDIWPAELYLSATQELAISPDKLTRLFPSTGFLATHYFLGQLDPQEWEIKLCGFTWQGWKRHCWAEEKEWLLQKEQQGLITFL